VTPLEPRTPHQSEKLKKRSKNEFVFTPSIIFVNQKSPPASIRVFSRVHAVHSPVTGFGASTGLISDQKPLGTRFFAEHKSSTSNSTRRQTLFHFCEYRADAKTGHKFRH
jgi:hypothetical protein